MSLGLFPPNVGSVDKFRYFPIFFYLISRSLTHYPMITAVYVPAVILDVELIVTVTVPEVNV